MSDSGNSTRDWLLKKLLKADRSIVEQAAEIKILRQSIDGWNADYQAQAGRFVDQREEDRQTIDNLTNRIREMAPEKQFRIRWEGPGRVELEILSVSSANGETTISVQRAGS